MRRPLFGHPCLFVPDAHPHLLPVVLAPYCLRMSALATDTSRKAAAERTVHGAIPPRVWPLLAPALIFLGSHLLLHPHMNAATPASPSANRTQLATFGGGCFWCLEAVFERVDGVLTVTAGYAGGHAAYPTYKEVCSGSTGHAEVVQIAFDPSRVRFEQLLDLFWKAHDPTTPNRQGGDVGTQYRSIILTHTDEQRQLAEKSREGVARHFRNPVVTEIVPLRAFYPAEEYHQDYFRKNPRAPYCEVVIRPKLEKLKKASPL